MADKTHIGISIHEETLLGDGGVILRTADGEEVEFAQDGLIGGVEDGGDLRGGLMGGRGGRGRRALVGEVGGVEDGVGIDADGGRLSGGLGRGRGGRVELKSHADGGRVVGVVVGDGGDDEAVGIEVFGELLGGFGVFDGADAEALHGEEGFVEGEDVEVLDLLHLGVEGVGDDEGVEVAAAGEVDGGGDGEGAGGVVGGVEGGFEGRGFFGKEVVAGGEGEGGGREGEGKEDGTSAEQGNPP
jgi:hypothetical protein